MRLFGLVGHSLGHSFSQEYFTRKFEQLGLADCRYELFELAAIRDLSALRAAHPTLAGLNVTVPYKEQIWPQLDAVALSAARVGAVNVVEFAADGRLVGHNTDWLGFRDSLRPFFPLRDKAARALILGTGGAAKAVEVALRDLGIASLFVTRNPLGAGLTYEELTPAIISAHSLIVNATPVGTYPAVDECPALPYHALTPHHYLYDLVYNPAETLFLQKGREAGAQVKNGFEMLGRQAEAAWDIWNGR